MTTRSFEVVAATAICLLAFLPGATAAGGSPAFRVLLFTKTAGFRHDSIPAATAAIEQLGARGDFAVDSTEDAGAFTDANLARYRVVAFVLTSGDVLDPNQQAAFVRFVRHGGGFVGVHSASDTEYDWPWYGALLGAYFKSHPEIQQATIDVTNLRTPSTVHLPAQWTRTDEWYDFQHSPRGSVSVLATLDESNYSPGPDAMGSDHPIMWQHVYDGGRSWYFAGGHTSASYAEPLFRDALLGGILWAGGLDLPHIASTTAQVAGRRLTVTIHHNACVTCRVRLSVRAAGRSTTFAVPGQGTLTRARTAPLLPGSWRYTVTLVDTAMAAHAAASGRIRVPNG